MLLNEIEFLERVTMAMNVCPNIGVVVLDIHSSVKACQDFQQVRKLSYTAISKFLAYCANKKYIDKDDYDQRAIHSFKVDAELALYELEDFNKKRILEGWD